MDTEKAVKYWVDNAEEKWKTAQSLFKSERFADCLFFSHLAIECLLKALISRHGEIPLPIHNLVRLAEIAQLNFSDEQREYLEIMTGFNLEARYPDYKHAFYKQATQEYTEKYFRITKDLIIWLKNLIKNKQ